MDDSSRVGARGQRRGWLGAVRGMPARYGAGRGMPARDGAGRAGTRRGARAAALTAAVLLLAGCGSGTGGDGGAASGASGASSAAAPATSPAAAEAPVASPACGGATTETPAAGSTTSQSFDLPDGAHTYELYVPASYTPGTPAPLVVGFHGSGLNGAAHLAFTSMKADADANGYIVAAPNAANMFGWFKVGSSMTDPKPDSALVDGILAHVGSTVCVDQTRRYAQGFSAGAGLIFLLLCEPQRQFAAYGGAGFALPVTGCPNTPPAPLIYFHGTADPSSEYQGTTYGSFTIPPVPQIMSDWAAHNKCAEPPATTTIGAVTRQLWTGCADDDNVDFYAIPDGGHTWPGGDPQIAAAIEGQFGKTTTDVAATPLMWEFFSQYRTAG